MKNELKEIKDASFAKRILALIMDAAVTIFVMFGLMVLVFVPIADKGLHYSKKVATRLQYQFASGLFAYYETGENNEVKVYSISEKHNLSDEAEFALISDISGLDESFYINSVKYYFLNYKTGKDIIYPAEDNAEDYKAPNYKDLIDGKSPLEIYTEDWFNGKVEELKTKEKIMMLAFEDMAEQDYYLESNSQIKKVQFFIILPPFFLSFAIFFIVVPLCFKNGETFGKKTLHLALINKDGYKVQKRQIILRQTTLLLYVGLCSFVIGVGLTSFATLGVGVLIYFVATIISKSHRSPVDYLSYTLLVDSLHSVWFKDAYEEKAKLQEIDENLENFSKNKIENKNIIQVGSTIVNEDIKQEVESENKKHK